MAYGDPGQSFADVMQARKAGKEQQFFGNLLQYGMSAGGQFDMVEGDPVYTGGTSMPNKTALWNSYVSMKGGRISAQDVQNFESQYTQASTMRTQKQMAELSKLKMKGATDSQIEDAIEDSPQLYQSLMDLVSDLESSGDENAFAQAQQVRAYLPGTGSPIENLMKEPGLMGRVGGPLALAGAVTGYGYLAGTPEEQIEAAKKATETRGETAKKIREERAKLQKIPLGRDSKIIKRDLANANKALKSESNKNVLQRNDQKMKDLRAKVTALKNEQTSAKSTFNKRGKIRKTLTGLVEGKTAKVTPEARYKTLGKTIKGYGGGGLAGGILGYAALGQGGALGEYLGGETGGTVGRTVGNLGMLALSLRGGYAAPLLAAAPAYDLYQQLKGK
jgi:hypothetical protein